MRLPAWAVFGAAAAGCSLIIPLDYVGGGSSAGASGAGMGSGGGSGGGAPRGGTSNGAEAGAGEGGNGEAGSTTEGGVGGSSGRGGTNTGGQGGSTSGVGGAEMGGTSMGGVGGSSMGGDDSGGAPEGGAGNSMGGTSGGGVGGGGAGSGGRGGRGGMGGTAGCSFDLTSNPLHCGTCTTACPVGDECIDSKCVSSPCDELGCGSVQQADYQSDGPRKTSVNTTNDVCVEVPTYTPTSNASFVWSPAINCWNPNGRTIEVNNVAVSCGSDQPLPMPKRKGGYCFHATAGGTSDTGFVMPYAASNCCKTPTAGTGGT